MFLVPNIDQMYKEMKKIVEVGNKHGNGDEFPDFADLFFFCILKNVRVGDQKVKIGLYMACSKFLPFTAGKLFVCSLICS